MYFIDIKLSRGIVVLGFVVVINFLIMIDVVNEFIFLFFGFWVG